MLFETLARTRTIRLRLIATAFCLSVFMTLTAYAQQDQGTITGTVTDTTGAVVPGATVTVTDVNTGFTLTRTSDKGGVFTVAPLKIGVYNVKASAPGFSAVQRSGLHLHAQERLGVALQLKIGSATETVDVSTEGAQMQTEESSTGQVVSTRTIDETALNGRNYLYIAQLTAGVLPPTQGSRGEAKGDFSANGQRPEQNNFVLDGVDNNVNLADFLNNASYVIKPPPDALQEFSVQTSDYSAELGHDAGGVVNASIKSGTNNLHGSLWEYFRNDKLNNRDYFQPRKPEYRQNQFGATLGGPIIKNKLFVFGDVEASRIIYALTAPYNVPTLTMRNSGFTDFTDLLHTGPTGNGKNYPIVLFQPGGPSTRNGSGAGTNNFLACSGVQNTLCPGQVTATAKKILNLYPLPNAGAVGQLNSNYIFQQKVSDNTTQYDLRADWNISQSDQTFARYSYSQEPKLFAAPLGPILDGGGFGTSGNIETEGRNFTASETHIFTPSVANELRFGYNWIHAAYLQENIGTNASAPLGLEGIPFSNLNGGLVGMNISGLSRAGTPSFYPSSEYENVAQVLDNVTMVRGNHTIKIGVNFQRIRPSTLQPVSPKGAYTFNGRFSQDPNNTGTTGSGIADFAQEELTSSSINSLFWTNDQRWYDAAFVQDDWKVTPHLTLNLGLRWEYAQPPIERHGYQGNLVPAFGAGGGGSTTGTAATGEYLIPKKAQNFPLPPVLVKDLAANNIALVYTSNESLIDSHHTDFAPRVGFAFSPNNKLVVRSGFGIFYGGLENIGYGPNLGGSSPFASASSSLAAPGACKPGSCYGPTFGGVNQTISAYTPPTIPSGATTSVGFSAGLLNGRVNPAFVSSPGLKSYNVVNKTPYTIGYNLSVQYAVTRTAAATISYVGNVDRHLGVQNGLNVYAGLLPAGTNYTPYLPFPNFGGGNQVTFVGNSNYNSFQAKLEQRASRNLTFLATYTYSHALDDARPPLNGTGQASYRNTRYLGPNYDYGSDLQDIRHRATFNGQYTLPFGKGQRHLNGSGVGNVFVGGWATSLTFRVQTGEPVDLTANNTLGNGTSYPLKVAGMGPFATGGTAISNPCATKTRTVQHWFNPCAFVNPPNVPGLCKAAPCAAGTVPLGTPLSSIYYGARGATQVAGPGYNRIDMSIFKNFAFYRESRLQFRADVFNLFNTPAYGQPATNIGGGGGNVNGATETGSFGQITHERFNGEQPDSRNIQLALKVQF